MQWAYASLNKPFLYNIRVLGSNLPKIFFFFLFFLVFLSQFFVVLVVIVLSSK